MRWATFQVPSAPTERIGVVRGDEIYAMAAGPRLIDLLGDDGERLAAAGAKTLASPAEVVRIDRVRLLPPISRPPAVRDFMTFRQHIESIRKSQGLELRSEEHTSELQSRLHLVCRLLLEKKKQRRV